VDTFIEIGPGKVLSGFVRKIDRKKKVISIDRVEDLGGLMDEIK
jgi:[acyl-carrier-protein] S-malonyltransferase